MRIAGFLVAVLFAGGCKPSNMDDQPKYLPLEPSSFFADGRASRPLVEGTIARGALELDTRFFQGKADGKDIAEIPVPVTEEFIRRGQERFNIWCQVCHDRMGTGNGMIVQRGYRKPPSYAEKRLLDAPAGHFFDVIANGWGAMPAYGAFVPPRDRWAITAYIRALQLARTAKVADVPADKRTILSGEARP